jgi:hypothetical protein
MMDGYLLAYTEKKAQMKWIILCGHLLYLS